MEKKMEKFNTIWLKLTLIFLIAGVYNNLYGDDFLGSITITIALVLFINYLILKIKGNVKTDEMTKRISGISSDIAFFTAIITIAILSIVLHYYPKLIDAKGVLVVLLFVILMSKVVCQLYYIKIKKEIIF